MTRSFEIVVAGGGLAGQLAALAFAAKGFSVALVAPAQPRPDARTTALMDQSIGLVRDLGLWEDIRPKAAALATMQIIDGTGRLFHAPPVAFKAGEIGLEAFGYNIPNQPFLERLGAAIAAEPAITRIEDSVAAATILPEGADLDLASGEQIRADLVVGADGRKSVIREAAGIGTRTWSYPQTALVLNFSHSVPHGNASTEFHTPTGPFTQVPLPGNRSSLVWVVRPDQAEDLLRLDPADFARRVEDRMQSMLGKVTVETMPQAWPLSGMTALRFGKDSAILVGEAGHVFPPIGAQGLNLSLRDIMTATELAFARRQAGQSLAIGAEFDSRRRADIVSRTAGVDLLNRSLLSSLLPVQVLRTAGLVLLSSLPPLRQAVMQEGVEPGRARRGLPALLREKIGRKRA